MTTTIHREPDPVTVDWTDCRLFSPLPVCDDDTCGCSYCEGERAEREERATSDASCVQLIAARYQSRSADVAALFTAYDSGSGPDPDYPGATLDQDQAAERLTELPLGIEVRRVLRVELSAGGPADYITADLDPDGRISAAEYHYADWFDHAAQAIAEDSALWRLAEYYAEAVPA